MTAAFNLLFNDNLRDRSSDEYLQTVSSLENFVSIVVSYTLSLQLTNNYFIDYGGNENMNANLLNGLIVKNLGTWFL